MDKKTLKDALDICKQGNFMEATYMLQNIDGEINNKWVMAFMINCCHICVANSATPENFSVDDLYRLLNHIVSNTKDMNESDLLNYCRSVFHILKFIINKKCYHLITKMENILVPSFLPPSLPQLKNLSDTYQSIAGLLYNLIAETTEHREFLSEIGIIISKIYAVVSNSSALLNTSYKVGVRLSSLSRPIKEQEAYYFEILKSVKLNNMKVNTEEDFRSLVAHYTLISHNILKEFDFERAAEFYEKSFQTGTQIFNSNDCVNVFTLLRFPLVLSPINYNDKLENLIKCKRSLTNIDSVTQKELAGSKLHSLIHTLVFSYYKSVNQLDWCKHSEICRLELLQFMWDISRLELLPKYSCSCKCVTEKNIYQAFSYSQYVYTLAEICVRQKSASSNFNREAANLITLFGEDIKILKEYRCEKWKAAWNILGTVMYNIGVYLYQNNDRGCLDYIYNIIKYFIILEYHNTTDNLKPSAVISSFTIICNSNISDYRKCMVFSALAILLCPEQRNNFISNWLKAKVSQREANTAESNIAQRITLVSVFQHFKKEIEFLTDSVTLLTIPNKIDLLVYELEQYKLKWRSKVPMMSALKELYEVAELEKTVRVIVNIFGDCEVMLHEDVPKLLQEILKQYEKNVTNSKNATNESMVSLAVLYYMNYKYCVKDIIIKNSKDMDYTMNVPSKTAEPPDAIPKDPNEECDIVSSYDSLKLDKYFGVMKYLEQSLYWFASAIKDNFNSHHSQPSTLYNFVTRISFEYRLHRYKIKSLQGFELALKIAQFENNSGNIIWAISFIIENSDVKRSYVKDLISIADKELNNITPCSIPNLKIILTYYICKAKCLIYDNYKEAYKVYQMAEDLYDKQGDKSELQLIKSQLHLVHFKFVLLPCDFNIVDHQNSTLLTIHLANSVVYEVYNNSKLDSPYEMSILLDANEELAKLYYLLRCPREVRCFCKETVILAQKLVLPMRCASYLVYLAHADLHSSRYDDCQVKVKGLADILCLDKGNSPKDLENNPSSFTEIEKDIASVTNDMQQMSLDLPMREGYLKQFSPSSPTLVIKPFYFPSFMKHETSCECFYCISLEYQNLVIEKTRLDALLNVKHHNVSIATDFFQAGLKFYELCSERYKSYKKTMTKFITCDLVPEFSHELIGSYGFLLVNYSQHLLRLENTSESLKVTDDLLDLVTPRKLQNIHLYSEALFLKLDHITDFPLNSNDNKVEGMESFYSEVAADMSTTPESKQSKVSVPIPDLPVTPPKRRVKKCLPFNIPPEVNTSNSSKNLEEPSTSKQPKTPVPKIKIYSSNTTVGKTKPTVHIFKDGSKKTKKKTIDAASTPVASCSSEPEFDLKSKTKLLTQKLKQSSKKTNVPVGDDIGQGDTKSEDGKMKLSSRKNLFDQGKSEGSNLPQAGAIRRSARNRKI